MAMMNLKHNRRAMSRLSTTVAVTLLAAVAVAIATLQTRTSAADSHYVASEAGIPLELIAVRPDGDDEVFTPDGKSLGKRPNYLFGLATWKDDQMYRQFIFEGPQPDPPVFFAPFVDVRISGTDRGSDTSQWFQAGQLPDKVHYVFDLIFDRTYPAHGKDQTVERLDLTLRYWQGPRGEAEYTFEGPFEIGKPVTATNVSSARLEPVSYDSTWGTQLTATLPSAVDWNQALVYDMEGRRHRPLAGASSGSQGVEVRLQVDGLRPDQISAITFGEPPQAKTFKNIVVNYPDRPHRTHAPWLDRLAEALNVPDLPRRVAKRQRWTNAAGVDAREALRVAPLVRAPGIRSLWELLRQGDQRLDGDFGPAALPEAQAQQLRELFMAWAQQEPPLAVGASPGPQLCIPGAYGLDMGLFMQWPEFVDPALDLLERGVTAREAAPSRALMFYRSPFTAKQLQRIQGIIRQTRDPNVLSSLLSALRRHNDEGGHWKVLIGLAEEPGQPWVWWSILGPWGNSIMHTLPEDQRSDILRRRLVLAQAHDQQYIPAGRPELVEQAYQMLPGIVADPMMLMMDGGGWSQARRLLEAHRPKGEATAAQVALLRRMHEPARYWSAVLSIARSINRLHGIDLAGVGTHEVDGRDEPNACDWHELAQEVIEWYAAEPSESAADEVGRIRAWGGSGTHLGRPA